MQEIEIVEFQEEGYKALVDYQEWRVAVLKFCEDLRIENIKTMQRHMETDEVFVLLQGECSLFSGGKEETVCQLKKVSMIPHKLYVVKKGVWHNHIMSEDGEVLIVENQNTGDENSPIVKLLEEQICFIRKL